MYTTYHFNTCMYISIGVGKTALLMRWSGDPFEKDCPSTIGVDFRIRHDVVDYEDEKDQGTRQLQVKTQLWDTAGQERFRAITSSYYRGADAIIIAYDLTSPETLNNAISMWSEEVKRFSNSDAEVVLLGTKLDLLQDPSAGSGYSAAAVAAISNGASAAGSIGVKHFVTSATEKESIVQSPLKSIVASVAAKKERVRLRDRAGGWVNVDDTTTVQATKGSKRHGVKGWCSIL